MSEHRFERLRAAMRVYAITPDTLESPEDYGAAVRAAHGVTAVQFRDKRRRDPELVRACAEATFAECRRQGALFVVNDDIELALLLGADAVHLGPEDGDVAAARALVGERMAIGSSAGTPERALGLVRAGADYLGIGAIYDASPSKPNASAARGPEVLRLLRQTSGLGSVPIVAIGGITHENARECRSAGADGVAAIRGILGAPDIETAVAAYLLATA